MSHNVCICLSVLCIILVLRKQARKLENDIDMKLVAYTKVDSTASTSTSIDTAPLLGDHVFDSLSLEIEQLLEQVITILTREH